MDAHLWTIVALFALFFLFAVAEAAAHLLSKHRLQVLLDSLRARSALNSLLLPRFAGSQRSNLRNGKLLILILMILHYASGPARPLWIHASLTGALLITLFYLPVIIAARQPRRLLSFILPVTRFANIVLIPLGWPRDFMFYRYRERARRVYGNGEETPEDVQEVEAYIDEAEEEGLFEPSEAEMVRQVVEFSDTVVREVMTPRKEMECIEKTMKLSDFSNRASELKFSRYPVIDGKIDNVVGIVHIKAMLDKNQEEQETATVGDIMAAPWFVPESKKVSRLLRDFQANKQQMAAVVDEYGGTAGLITLEDILEEIVGEIEDEHDEGTGTEVIKKNQDGSINVAGSVDVNEVEKLLDAELDDRSYETIGGMALNYLKHIPEAGEEFVTDGGVRVEIIDADERSINRVRLSRIEEEKDE